jgi:hypothetical protein
MSHKPNLFAQGDILFERLDEKNIPQGLVQEVKRDADGSLCLARGERSGHRHVADSETARLYREEQPWRFDANVVVGIMALSETTAIRHEEHDPIVLGPGTYRVRRQVLFQPSVRRAMIGGD